MFDIKELISFFRSKFARLDVIFILLLIVAYFATRLINLDNFPIFSDEGIYIRWAKVAWQDASWRFISLTDGKQPLQTWGTIPFLKLFPNDALIAGRLFSVATGFAGLIGFFTLSFYFFGKKAAYIGALLFITTPYFLFYDRMALVDSGVNAGFIWILFFSVLLARTVRLDVALLFSLTAGFTLLAKSSARIFIMLSLFAPILFYEKTLKKIVSRSISFYILMGLVFGLSLLIYNVQRLSPFFHYVALKNTTFILTTSEFLQDPFKVAGHNLTTVPMYVFWELGWLLVPLAAAGAFFLFKKDWRMAVYLLLWLILPYIAISLFGRVIFPRYLIFLGTLIMILATYFLSQIKDKRASYLTVGAVLLWQVIFSYPIVFKAEALNFPPIDRGQYVEGVTAVWGAAELMQMARDKSKEKPVLILAEGNFGLVGDVLDVYLKPGDTNMSITGLWPLGEKEILENVVQTKDKHVYIVFSHREEFPENWPIKLVKKFSKPIGDKAIYLYEYK